MCFISYIYCTILLEFTQYILHDLIFFKARDSDALKQALTEYADRVTTQKERKPSVLQKLRDYVAVVQNRVLERSKDKQKGQER